MKKLLVLFVLIAMVSCESKSGRKAQDRANNSIITTTNVVTVEVEPLVKVIASNILIHSVARVGVIEIEGKRYIVSSEGGIFEIKPKDN